MAKLGRKSNEAKKIEKRYGFICEECGCKLDEYRLTGRYNGKNISFCSFKCMDEYKDKNPPIETVLGEKL